jgi:diacylglycerol kinase (ATP)
MLFEGAARFLVIANPAAGQRQRRRLARTLSALKAAGARVTLVETAAPGDAMRIAKACGADAFDSVVAAGGDGTINEVANGLLGRSLPLGIIPLGTANILALELGIDRDPRAIARTLIGGRRQAVHLGQMGERRFLAMAGVGFDAEVCAHVDLALKRRAGKFAYVWETLTGMFGYGFPALSVRVDGVRLPAHGVVVCNARHYGGPFVAAPEASMQDESLQVCLLGRPGVVNVLRYGLALVLGCLGRLDDVTIRTGREIVVEGPSDLPVQGDGDVLGRLPITIRVAPETIEILVPDRLEMGQKLARDLGPREGQGVRAA